MIHQHDRQMDGRTDRIAMAKTRDSCFNKKFELMLTRRAKAYTTSSLLV